MQNTGTPDISIAARLQRTREALLVHIDLYRWTLQTIYAVAPGLTLGMAISSFLAGLTPVLVFIAIKGLLDANLSMAGGQQVSVSDLSPWLALLFGASIVEAIVSLSRKLLRDLLLDEANIDLSARIMTRAAQQPIAFFESHKNQDTLEQLQGQVATRLVELIHRLMVILTNIVVVLTLTMILASIEPLIILVAVPAFLPYLLFQIRLGRNNFSEHDRRTASRRRISYFIGLLTRKTWASEVRLLDLAPHLISRFKKNMITFQDEDAHKHRTDFNASMLFALLTLAGFFAVFTSVVAAALQGEATVGDVAIFAAAVVRLRKSLEDISTAISMGIEQAGRISVLRRFLTQPEHLSGPSSSDAMITLDNFQPEILCDHVSFKYPGSDVLVLDKLNLHIQPGEKIAIVGENGCGKSTLVKLLAGFYAPSEGSVLISGHDISTLPPQALRSRIAFVFQDFARYADSVSDNIAYGDWQRLKNNPDEIENVARQTGLHQHIEDMPDGYNTLLGREFGSIEPSGGMWQKIAITRAFARNAPVLILDEPTASVDARVEYQPNYHFQRIS